jgi:hypothetical protein
MAKKSRVITTGRSRGSKTGIFSRRRGYRPWISKSRSGKLGSGFLTDMTQKQRKKSLNRCIKRYGTRSCLGSVNVLNRNRSIAKKYSSEIKSSLKYLRKI